MTKTNNHNAAVFEGQIKGLIQGLKESKCGSCSNKVSGLCPNNATGSSIEEKIEDYPQIKKGFKTMVGTIFVEECTSYIRRQEKINNKGETEFVWDRTQGKFVKVYKRKK